MTACQFVTDLKTIFDDSLILDATVETLVDAVVDELNLNGCNISNMDGTAGSKTITLTSAQKGAIRSIFRCMYASWHKNASNQNAGISPLTLSNIDLMSNPVILNMIRQVASQLIGRSFKRA